MERRFVINFFLLCLIPCSWSWCIVPFANWGICILMTCFVCHSQISQAGAGSHPRFQDMVKPCPWLSQFWKTNDSHLQKIILKKGHLVPLFIGSIALLSLDQQSLRSCARVVFEGVLYPSWFLLTNDLVGIPQSPEQQLHLWAGISLLTGTGSQLTISLQNVLCEHEEGGLISVTLVIFCLFYLILWYSVGLSLLLMKGRSVCVTGAMWI